MAERGRWDEYLAKAETALDKAITRVAVQIERRAKELTSAKVSPPTSTFGQPPHVQTGTLTRSLSSWTTREKGKFTGHVGFKDGFPEYALYLELGWTPPKPRKPRGDLADGRAPRRFHIRPFLRPAIREFEGTFFDEVANAFITVELRG